MKHDFVKITHHERMPISVLSLYLSAFPCDERRPCRGLFALIDDPESPMEFRVIVDNDLPAGFITTWDAGDFIYVEHFAIFPHLRGNGLGAHAMRDIAAIKGKPIVLEVELPGSTADAQRRIDFYSRAGFTAHDTYEYIQPAYSPLQSSLPMMLMSAGDIDLDSVRDYLYSRVYGVESAAKVVS